MIKRKHRRKNQKRNKYSIWWWLCAALAVLVVILIIDIKPWRKHRIVVSDQWPYNDITKGVYTKDFDGLDISRHQGRIHWDELVEKNPQLKFVYIKATEGSSVVDPFYKKNFKAAKKRGLLVGSYHFLTYRTSMERQVTNFLDHIDLSKQDLLLLVDVEKDGTREWGRDLIQKNLAEFIRLIKERTGHYPMIYTNESYYHKNLYPEFNRYHLFIANYSLSPEIPDTKHDIWQFSKRGRVHGIWTYVDINQLREGVTVDDLKMPK